MSKLELCIGSEESSNMLPARAALMALKSGASYHEKKDTRHPLGIYNISSLRICNKVKKCADKLHTYWEDTGASGIAEEIIDYFELAIYSAAEHIDDVERIAYSFYPTNRDASKSTHIRRFKKAVKPLRDEISNFTNTIKHAHGRIRLFEVDFIHNKNKITLLGFFIEGYRNAGVAPNPILHNNGKNIISITSFLWNILIYMHEISLELFKFLAGLNVIKERKLKNTDVTEFKDASLSLASLPLYSLDDIHPFNRVKIILDMDEKMHEKVGNKIYGSLLQPWSKFGVGKFVNMKLLYGGDGVTKNFHLVQPDKLSIQSWDKN